MKKISLSLMLAAALCACSPQYDWRGYRSNEAPYAVLFKPSHGGRILRNQQAGGFSPKAAYIFKKQLEEAEGRVEILLKKADGKLAAEPFEPEAESGS